MLRTSKLPQPPDALNDIRPDGFSSPEKLMSIMVNSIQGLAMVMTDPDGIILSWNRGAEAIKGYTEQEIIGKSLNVFYTAEDIERDEPGRNLKLALKNQTHYAEGWRVRKDGTKFWADIQYTALFNDNGTHLGYAKIVRDLTAEKLSTKQQIKQATDAIERNYDATILVEDARFRKLVENSQTGITLLSEDLKVIYRSNSAERISGWATAERKHNTFKDLIHLDDLDNVEAILTDVIMYPSLSRTAVFRSKHSKGHFIWLECIFTNMLYEHDIAAIVCNYKDVTDQKQATDALQQIVNELSAYKYALDESAIVAITDQKGIIKHVNNNFCKISKYSKNELLGQDHRIINSGYHDKAFIKEIWTTIANGKIWRGELKNKAKDGSYYWVDTTVVPFLNEDGKPYQYVAIRSDITERKLNEQKIIESERFIKTITDSLPAMVSYWTADLYCLFANRAYCNWFDKQPHEIIGMNRFELLKNSPDFELRNYHTQKVLKGEPQGFDVLTQNSKGVKTYLQFHYIPQYENGTVKGFFALIYDISETKKAELEINKKNAQIDDLLENITDGFISLDEERRYLYANKKNEEIVGISSSSLIGKNVWDAFPEVVGTRLYDAIETVYREKRYLLTEDFYRSTNLWLETRIYPSGDGVSIFIRDISERKLAEEQIKQLNDRFTLMSKATNDALFEWNFEKEEIWWSETHFKMFGFDPNLPIPTREEWLSKIRPESQLEIETLRSSILNSSLDKWQNEIEYTKPDNTAGTLLNRGFVIRNQAGKPIRMLGSYIDITHQKNEQLQRNLLMEAVTNALKERNDILESIGDAFFAVDKNWTVTYWNHIAEKVLNVSKKEIIDKNLWDVFKDSVNTESHVNYNKAIASEKSVHFEDYYAALNKWYEVSAYPSGKGLSVYFKDITERKVSEIKLNELNEELRKHARELAVSNAELEQFAYVASHDLQEPLRMVTSFLTQLEKKYNDVIDEKGKQYIFFAVDGAKRMRQIILDLLEFSRVGRTENDLEVVDLNVLMNEITTLYRKKIEDRKAKIICDKLPTILSHKAPMRQVFQNLISNALKYQRQNVSPVIKVSVTENAERWQFAVSDNGLGIDAEYFEKIFIIFQRLHNKDEYSGTGMGLAVTKKIIESSGGKIWLKSTEGAGSTFYFTILKNR